MNSYEFFECILEEKYNSRMKYTLSPDLLTELFKKSLSRIDICSGEMSIFNNVDLAKELENVLYQKSGEVEVNIICGNRIIGTKTTQNTKAENPFLRTLLDKDFATIYFNPHDIIDQIANGYTHSIMIDGGKYIYLEEPHSYRKLKEREQSAPPRSLFIKNDYDLGLELFQRRISYIKFAQLQNADAKTIEENTFDAETFFEYEADYKLEFDNREEFEKHRAESMSKRLMNNDVDIENFERFIL